MFGTRRQTLGIKAERELAFSPACAEAKLPSNAAARLV